MTEAKKRPHRRTGRKTGPPAYRPTEQERRCVATMSAMGLNQDLIGWAIGSGIRGRPGKMSKTCLHAHFANELENGAAILRLEISMKFRKAINAGQPWALSMAMRNMQPWRWDRYDSKGLPLLAGDSEKTINVEFVVPSRKEPPHNNDQTINPNNQTPVIDAYANKTPDYSKPALEPLRPRFRTESGAVYEMPRGSIFQPPDPKGWMK
jgi:hypothetical protein